MKKFKGYFCVGAVSREAAKEGKGMVLWSQSKPSKFIQFTNRILLNIYWIDEERTQLQRGEKLQKSPNTEVSKDTPDKYKKQ